MAEIALIIIYTLFKFTSINYSSYIINLKRDLVKKHQDRISSINIDLTIK